jgi:hypothetical protein
MDAAARIPQIAPTAIVLDATAARATVGTASVAHVIAASVTALTAVVLDAAAQPVPLQPKLDNRFQLATGSPEASIFSIFQIRWHISVKYYGFQ